MTIPATKWLTGQTLLVKQEYRTPWGICDLVGLELEQSRVTARRLLGQRVPIGPPPRIALLREVPWAETGQSVSLAILSSVLGRPVGEIAKDAKELLARGFLVKCNDGAYQSRCTWVPLHRRIITIELKVDRINEAIQQARAHRLFATQSYIGLPAPLAERTYARSEELQAEGVGLLSVCASGATVLVPAPTLPATEGDAVLQMHCVERFWRDFISTLA
jgi:hypothetical protein